MTNKKMSFLSKIFGGKNNARVRVFINDDAIEVLSVQERIRGDIEFLGANKVDLKEGIVLNGDIISRSNVKKSLKKAFLEAVPQKIEAKEIMAIVPNNKIFPFIDVFSASSKDDYLQKSAEDMIKEGAPFEPTELEWDYVRKDLSRSIIFGAYAYPKKWANSIRQVCSELGIEKVNFISAPMAQAKLVPGENKDFLLFSQAPDGIFVSVFYKGIMYDCYTAEKKEYFYKGIFSEYLQEAEYFKSKYDEDLKQIYFVDMQDLVWPLPADIDKPEGVLMDVLRPQDSKIAGMFYSKEYSSVIMGLGEYLVH